jgi:error-prone DNA polymerase
MLRRQLAARRCRRSRELAPLPHGTPVRMAGLVTLRQRPETASGVTFVTLEDEDGLFNVVVWRDVGERPAARAAGSRGCCRSRAGWKSAEGVQHLIAARLQDLSPCWASWAARVRAISADSGAPQFGP